MNFLSSKKISTFISVFVFLSSNIFMFPIEIADVSAAPVINEVDAMKYLARYGYTQITEEEIENGYRISKKSMTETLKEFQKFSNLEVTGNLDSETVKKMQQPRCAVPDKFPGHLRKKRYDIGENKWNKKTMTFKMNNTFLKKYDIPDSAVESDFDRALKLWQQYIPIQLEIYNQSETDPDVLVSFEIGNHADEDSFDGPGGTLAHATYPTPGRKYFIHLDGEESWYFKNGEYSYGNGSKESFYKTATHEIGHTLGLAHSEDENAVMYPSISEKSDSDFRLSADDIEGIQERYSD